MTVSTELPGVQPSQICEKLDDFHAAQLLPTGAFNLINAIDPGRINSSKRVETLSSRPALPCGAMIQAKLGRAASKISE